MRVVITDVSALFDIYSLGILPEFFGLEFEFCITDFVYNEITKIDQISEFEVFVRSKKLKVVTLDVKESDAIQTHNWKFSNRSINDKSVIWKGIQLRAIVLTCDGQIKKEAEFHGLEVHGSIWVVQQLEQTKQITTSKAIRLLEQLKEIGVRLPLDTINKIIKRYKTQMD